MIMLLDSSTPVCRLTLYSAKGEYHYDWQSDRQLANGLLAFIEDCLAKHHVSYSDLRGIGVMRGPGSYTGLRIGITVCNTIAEAQSIPIVGATGESWRQSAIKRLQADKNEHIVLPEYGGQANITKPRK